MKLRNLHRYGLGLLLLWSLFVSLPVSLQAATGYEVSNIVLAPTVTGQYVRVPATGLDVTWNAPADAASVMYYYLKFTTSNTPLTNQELNDTVNDFAVTGADQSIFSKTIAQSFFTSYDSNQVHYLHIKTQYVPGSYSDDVVVGPILVDNANPTGTISLNPSSGSSTQFDITVSPSEPVYYWLSNTATFPGGGGQDSRISTTATWNLSPETPYRNVTIYSWLQDIALNPQTLSAPTATAIYAYQAPVAITPNTASIEVGNSQVFTVDGSTTYTWTLNVTSETVVAAFSGGSTGVASVTVLSSAAGTFTLTATPTSGSPLTSGTITVVQTVKPGDVNNDGDITLDDVKLAFGFFLGASSNAQQFSAANVYDDSDGNTSISLHDVKGVFTLFLGGTL